VPFFAVGNLATNELRQLEGFNRRTRWFLENRKDLAQQISFFEERSIESLQGVYNPSVKTIYNLAIPNEHKIKKVLKCVLDESEFLSDYGIRSLSKVHLDSPYKAEFGSQTYEVKYVPGESNTSLFGGNSNWRGPIWFPMNFLFIESLTRFYNFYGKKTTIEYPTGSGKEISLNEISYDLMSRMVKLFIPDKYGARPCHGNNKLYAQDPHWKDLILFYEYFHGDNGKGLGASHQTGWTALVALFLDDIGKARENFLKKEDCANEKIQHVSSKESINIHEKKSQHHLRLNFKKMKYGSVTNLHFDNLKPTQ